MVVGNEEEEEEEELVQKLHEGELPKSRGRRQTSCARETRERVTLTIGFLVSRTKMSDDFRHCKIRDLVNAGINPRRILIWFRAERVLRKKGKREKKVNKAWTTLPVAKRREKKKRRFPR